MVAVITAAFPWKSAMIGISSTKTLFPWAARTRYLTWPTSTNIANLFSWSAARKRDEMLELYEGKPSRTVLRRESGSNPTDLAGTLSLALLSRKSELNVCHIALLDQADAADFFAMHSGDYAGNDFYGGTWSC